MRRRLFVTGAAVCVLGLMAAAGSGCGPSDEGTIDLSAAKAKAAERGLDRENRPPSTPDKKAMAKPPERIDGR